MIAGDAVGPYRVLGKLGEGGMGQVYRARDTRLDRDVAIKTLHDVFAADPTGLARFEREARTLAALNHPHIAQIYGIEGDGDTRALVMELVEGPTLADRLAPGPLPVEECVTIARQVADALEAAHEAGVIHRDVKPANIKVRADGVVKVLDFGLAKTAEDRAHADLTRSPTFASPAMTSAGMIVGTAAYMSPEQARGRAVDRRADIWAFGCLLYEMLTGRPAFGGETVTDVLAAVVKTDPDWTALDAPPPLRRLVMRCLQKDPRQRLRDIGDARLELAEPMAGGEAASPRKGRRLAPLVAAALLLLAGGAAGGVIWQRSRPAPPVVEQWSGTDLGGPKVVLNPRLSPDGQLLAFLTVVDGLTQIAVMRPGTANWTVVTRDRTQGLTFTLSWSPDSSRLYYDRFMDSPRGVFTVPALGGEERLVIDNARSPESLPDGSLVVLRINAERQPQLHRFWPANGRLEALPGILLQDEAEATLRALPGGRSIVFIGRPLSGANRSPGLYELDLESKQVTRFGRSLAVPIAGRGVQPSLAVRPDDGSVFVSVRDRGLTRVFHIDRDAAIEPQSALMFPMSADIDAGRGGDLYVALSQQPVSLVRIGQTAADLVRDGDGPALTAAGIAPLPDGRILVQSRSGNRARILVLAEGKPPTPLVETEEDTLAPMTAVGSRQAAVVIGSGATTDIAIVESSTGRIVERFPAPPQLTSLAASPDGRTLYATAGGTLSVLPRTGSQARTLGAGDSVTVDPATGDLIVKLDAQERFKLGLACRAVGDAESAALEFSAARSVFRDLGAAHDLAQLDAVQNDGMPTPRHPLTTRECQVLRLIAAGNTNRAIARELSLSERTIDRHVSNILTKLDVPSRAAATAYAYSRKLF
jgi:DNA-binding CsgD family transcriptional regulator